MYSHVSKGFTVGHVLTRRLLRSLTSIPGVILDLGFAVFWVPSYSDYWENSSIEYLDGTRTGWMEGIFGWIGEAAGFTIGAPLGAIIGATLYFPDGILRLAYWIGENISTGLDAAATSIGEREFFTGLTFTKPANFISKTSNISAATLGVVAGIALYAVPRAVEFVLPFLGNSMSRFAFNSGITLGGVIGFTLAIPVYPVVHIADRLAQGYINFRDSIRSFTAFTYARGNQNLFKHNERDDCFTDEIVHSREFRDKYAEYKTKSTTEILFGKMRADAAAEQPLIDDDVLKDPISLERLENPVVDPEGHTFSRSSITSWLSRGNHTCPVGREALRADQLRPNYVLAQAMARGLLRK